MFIASRNQVDLERWRYVNSWDQKRFSEDPANSSEGWHGGLYLPLPRSRWSLAARRRSATLLEDEAMELAKKSYLADMLNGFDLLMIDPAKDQHEISRGYSA